MTEEEAKTKWCPFVRVAAGAGCIGGVSNRQDGSHNKTPDGNPNCIGSACMAWRWDGDKTEGTIIEERTIGAGEQYPAAPAGHRWRTGAKDVGHGPRPIALFARIGFCGLAGKP